MLATETRWRLPPKRFVTSARFMMSGTPTCREGKRCCMADVATDDAGPAAATFTLRLAAVMLVTETGRTDSAARFYKLAQREGAEKWQRTNAINVE